MNKLEKKKLGVKKNSKMKKRSKTTDLNCFLGPRECSEGINYWIAGGRVNTLCTLIQIDRYIDRRTYRYINR